MSTSPQPDKPHHLPNSSGFVNPWPSFFPHTLTSFPSMLYDFDRKQSKVPPKEELIVKVVDKELMAWDKIRKGVTTQEGIQATWLGHAAFLIQMDGVNILCDPIFSHRCSPSQWVGPARFTPPPCKLEDLPPIDVVIISHNHYDHMDTSTLKALGPHPHYFYPLGNTPYFSSLKIPAENLHEMDWWDTHHLTLSDNRKVEIVCTPCQHFTGRGVLDRFKTLWASWAVLGQGKRFWFAGDTGYRYVPKDNTDLSLLPVCPAFKEIGAKYGPFDLSCIPIGAYSPRWFMSPIHCSPEDAVEVHKDVRSKKSIGMHWGTFVLTDEPVNEPPVRLKKSAADAGLVEGVFGVIHIGETVQVACPFS